MEITYQPVIDLQTGRLVKCEAFCRPPEAGVDLDAFVTSAELNGSLRSFTDRVLDRVIGDWQKQGPASLDLSINLSVADLAEHDLVKRVEKACKRHRFDVTRLWFEIDDRAQSIVDPGMLGNIAKLSGLGVRFSIDSFGDDIAQTTPYELQNLRIHEVKFDARYVRDADENMAHRNIIVSIVGMGRDLRIAVGVKGVNRENIAALMARLGVSLGQGYFFARPTSPATIVSLVERMTLAGPLPIGR